MMLLQALQIWDPPPINFDQGDWWLALLISWYLWSQSRKRVNGNG